MTFFTIQLHDNFSSFESVDLPSSERAKSVAVGKNHIAIL